MLNYASNSCNHATMLPGSFYTFEELIDTLKEHIHTLKRNYGKGSLIMPR